MINTLLEKGPSTRRDIAKKLKCPRTTIYDNLYKLMRKNLVERFSEEDKKAGRPMVYWKFNLEHE